MLLSLSHLIPGKPWPKRQDYISVNYCTYAKFVNVLAGCLEKQDIRPVKPRSTQYENNVKVIDGKRFV